MKILVVCLGNICRSPLAEGILKEKVRARGLDWQVDSAGTGAFHIGQAPDPRSIATARRKGIDISRQQARQIQASDLKDFDLILTMDQSNYRNVVRLSNDPQLTAKVRPVMDFVPNHVLREVPDPYWNDDGFEQVFHMLEEALEGVIEAQ